MADFMIRVDEQAFRNRGVTVGFDENRYGELLDELAQGAAVEQPPVVVVTPTADWGMSTLRRVVLTLARDESIEVRSRYDPRSKLITLQAGPDEAHTNKYLLNGTRRWAGDINGELAAARKVTYEARTFRRFALGGMGIVGALQGYELGGGDDASIGAIVGLMVGMGFGIADSTQNPHYKRIRQFTDNPEVIEQYGQILSYKSA